MGQSANSPKVLNGRYQLGDKLGSGGYGAVYEAQDRQLQRTVAIKLFDPKQTTAGALQERFQREAVATAAIRHPNVVTVFDVGITDDQIFIVMERLRGHPLTKELERWPHGMPATRALPLLVGTLEGLAAGHEAGIIHKDIKPSNLFLVAPNTPQEKLAIIDFGVARVMHEQKLTATGKLVGTPRYLAPEYIEDLRVSTALDVYQMGLIAVELLCGLPCLPRRLDLVTCCQRHVDGDLEIPDGLREGAIGEVVARATDVDPDARYQSAQQFADALAAVNPDDVKITTPSGHLPTPRIGVKPLTRPGIATQQMHGGKALMKKAERPSSLSMKQQEQRSTRTGPTKRLGPAKDVLEQLEKVAPEEKVPTRPVLTTQCEAEEKPDRVFDDDVPAPEVEPEVRREPTSEESIETGDPLAARRRAIYVLVFLAIVAVAATTAFFAMQFAQRSTPQADAPPVAEPERSLAASAQAPPPPVTEVTEVTEELAAPPEEPPQTEPKPSEPAPQLGEDEPSPESAPTRDMVEKEPPATNKTPDPEDVPADKEDDEGMWLLD